MSDPIDTGLFFPIGGLEQWVTIRGRDRSNPPLMILTGAGAAFSRMAPVFEPWEDAFTLVQWDQPGAGATLAAAGDKTGLITFERLIRDGVAVAEAVLKRLGGRRMALLAISAGTIVGLGMIRARPDLFSVYAANGQITNWARQEALSYRMILHRARTAGDAAALAEIETIGPPPWPAIQGDMIKGKYANAMTSAEQAVLSPAMMTQVRSPPDDARYVAHGLPAVDSYASSLVAYAQVRPAMATYDATADGLDFQVPMVFLQGEQDANTPAAEVQAFAARIRAPSVRYAAIEEGGHMSVVLRERMLALLLEHVRPLAD